MPSPNHKKLSHFARNYKTKAPPIRAPVMTMTAERIGSCSTAVAPLDLVEEEGEDVAELEPEGVALVPMEEVDTRNCTVSEAIQKGNSERR